MARTDCLFIALARENRPVSTFRIYPAGLLFLSSVIGACEGPTDTPGYVASVYEVTIAVETNGVDQDVDGYVLTIDGHITRPVESNGVITLSLDEGEHRIVLSSLASNCELNGATPMHVIVSAGTAATVALKVTCIGIGSIVYDGLASLGDLQIVSLRSISLSNVSPRHLLLNARDPAWNRDGTRLAYTSLVCTRIYYYTDGGCSPVGIGTASANGTGARTITSGYDEYPSWSPDGKRIVFHRSDGSQTGLYVVETNGSDLRKIPLPATVHWASEPTWSPDGGRIAFTCVIERQSEICTAKPDGSELRRLTPGSQASEQPAWSPDGSRIAFSTGLSPVVPWIATMGSDGSSPRELALGVSPSWSPDGLQIVFQGIASNSEPASLRVVNADGSGIASLGIPGRSPVWRP
jgi:hypothetical protein